MANFVRILSLLQGRRRRIGQIIVVSLYAAVGAFGFDVVLGLILRDAVNGAVNQDLQLLWRALLLAATATGVALVLYTITYLWGKRTVHLTMREIRRLLYTNLLHLPIARIERHHSGDLITRSTSDVDTLESAYFDQWAGAAQSWFIGIFAIGFAFWMDVRLGVALLINGLITFALSSITFKPLNRWSDEIRAAAGNLAQRFGDLVHGLVVTRLFGVDTVLRRFVEANDHLKQAALSKTRIGALSDPLWFIYGGFAEIIILAIGLPLVISRQVDLGSVLGVAWMQQNANYCFANIAYFVVELQKALAGAKRVFELFDMNHEFTTQDATYFPQATAANVDLVVDARSVSFVYPDVDQSEVLRNFSLQVRRGQTIALVGASGSGKSTFVKLLMGFYPLSGGDILLNGISIGRYPLDTLRASTAYVSQEAHMFNTSISDNIRYGNLTATHEQIVAAAIAADAHGFILEQQEGYATNVGERGTRLSGGQRQRIAIARAILKDAPLLLLDEATSALDTVSEAQVQHALNRLMVGRTTIIVAHRPSTIQSADWIYVLEDGSIVESGTHVGLVSSNGVYARLHKTS